MGSVVMKPIFVPPVYFRLGGREWRVRRVEKPGDWMGKCKDGLILLNMRRIKNNEELQHTFFHELLHAVAITMGWTELHEDEDKIDAMAGLLVQIENTAVY